jgi:hypothetical protein
MLAKPHSLRRKVIGVVALGLLLYVGLYWLCSRVLAERPGDLWAFFEAPAGLHSVERMQRYRYPGLTLWEGWKCWEQWPSTFFRPCIVVDEYLTGKRYLLTHNRTVCFN